MSNTLMVSGDQILVPVLEKALQGAMGKSLALYGSSIVAEMGGLPRANQSVGTSVIIPRCDMIGDFQLVPRANDRNGNPVPVEGVAVPPKKMAFTSQSAFVEHAILGVEASWFSRQTAPAGQDMYAEAARQLRIKERYFLDAYAIELALATFPSFASSYLVDRSSDAISMDMLVDAEAPWGDQISAFPQTMIVHSATARTLKKLKDNDGRYYWTGPTANSALPRIWDRDVIISDSMPAPSNGVARTLISLPGAIGIYRNDPRILTDSDNAADTESMYAHLYFAGVRYERHALIDKFPMIELRHRLEPVSP